MNRGLASMRSADWGSILSWLPELPDWAERIASARAIASPSERLAQVANLARHRRDFLVTGKLDRIAQNCLADPELCQNLTPVGLVRRRVAILASHSVDHHVPAVRTAGLSRGLALDVHVAPYGQYRQAMLGASSEIDAFHPDFVVLVLDVSDVGLNVPLGATQEAVERAIASKQDELVGYWRRARERFGAIVIQQTLLNSALPIFGNYEGVVAAAPYLLVEQLNCALRRAAQQEGVLLLDLDWHAARHGRRLWIDPVRWHHAKQLVSPVMSPLYGDLLARIVAAGAGLSKKCLVLDLDNTLWGGVIGDDGLASILLGQGSAAGEAFIAFQQYCRMLSQRGIILAVCSKNDEKTALEAFTSHPEMHLKRSEIAAFVANWEDKPRNIRRIADILSIGLDSLVFVDDNPAEREIVRQELPVVSVPELPDDVADYAERLADAGYFEAAAFTADDERRTEHYALNAQRRASQHAVTDMDGFLRGLEMVVTAQPFAAIDLERVTQLTNKTNQFNLTTRRHTRADIERFMKDSSVVTLQVRLSDRFGDNGLISVIVARPDSSWPNEALLIDTWLMSCRVLGRGVEQAVLEVLTRLSRAAGAQVLIGEHIPTSKNGLVAEHYPKLGFQPLQAPPSTAQEVSYWGLDLRTYRPKGHFISVREPAL